MGRFTKIFLSLVAAFAALFAVAAIAFFLFFDPNDFREDIAKAVKESTGRDLTIDGEVVQLAAQQNELVLFNCRHMSPKAALELYQRLQRDVAAVDLKIAQLEENALGEWTLTFSNGINLNIGADELDARVQRFIAVYSSELSDRVDQVVSVDARYANGVAVSWHEEPTVQLAMGMADHQTRTENGLR